MQLHFARTADAHSQQVPISPSIQIEVEGGAMVTGARMVDISVDGATVVAAGPSG